MLATLTVVILKISEAQFPRPPRPPRVPLVVGCTYDSTKNQAMPDPL